MAENSKIYINYDNIQTRHAEALASADGTDLSVLGAILLLAGESGFTNVADIEALEKFETSDIRASVKFWRGAGVLGARAAKDTAKATTQTAHKDGAITRTALEKYTNDELAEALVARVSEGFVDEAQKAMGKIFNSGEVGKLVGLVDQLGFEEEAVLAILSYCVRLGKKSLSYAEKIAVNFHDEDISTAEQVHAQIDYLERRGDAVGKVSALFGFGGRQLSSTEQKLFAKWTLEYAFSMEIITRAYEMTVDAIQAPAPKYTDKILTKWYSAGAKSLSDIELFDAEEKQQLASKRKTVDSRGKDAAKNAETDDWFEQRLQKSFSS